MSNSTVTLQHPTEKTSMKLEELKAAEAKLVLGTYDRYPLLFERGEGVYLIDENGVRYLDLLSGIGVNALGYAHPAIEKAITNRAASSSTRRTFITTRDKRRWRCG
jgi:4-aminobutyrate aminotransferase-like enzyme